MVITCIDHLVLTVTNIKKTIDFYESVLGMTAVRFAGNRVALKFGNQKINLHEIGNEFEPKAKHPTPGSADLCFLISMEIEKAKTFIQKQGVDIIKGVVDKIGAQDPLLSIYIRDPDNNLIELSNSK